MYSKSLPILQLLLFCVCSQVLAQWAKLPSSNEHVQVYQIDAQARGQLTMTQNELYTAIVLSSNDPVDLSKNELVLGDQVFPLAWDEHMIASDSLYFTNPIIIPRTNSAFNLLNAEKFNYLYLIDGNAEGIESKRKEEKEEGCERPESVPQSVWRAGLPSPSYQRSFTNVQHLVIHHSAGSNTNTNYIEVVRSIYLFHTQTRGWSDIGYNYLIAQDGTIFDGRDPLLGEQSNVLGAHFCGSNSRTMGVCLLGNYEEVQATEAMLKSTAKLLAWKADFDGLTVNATASHPLNSSLGTIAGHRDGCSTLCPGTNVYQRLEAIRDSISEAMDACYFELIEEPELLEMISVFPNPVEVGKVFVEVNEEQGELLWVDLVSMKGERIRPHRIIESPENYEFNFSTSLQGIFILRMRFENRTFYRRLLLK